MVGIKMPFELYLFKKCVQIQYIFTIFRGVNNFTHFFNKIIYLLMRYFKM